MLLGLLLLLAGVLPFAASPAGAAPASLTASPLYGPPGVKISVTGHHFTPQRVIDLYFDTERQRFTVSDANGDFTAPVDIAGQLPPGDHWISAVVRGGGLAAQTPFTVTTDWAMFGFDAAHRGWNPYENILGSDVLNDLDLQWQRTGGPAAIMNARLFEATGSQLVSLDPATGEVGWIRATAGPVTSSIAAVKGSIYLATTTGTIEAYNAVDGSTRWSVATGKTIQSGITVSAGYVYAADTTGSVYALRATDGTRVAVRSVGGAVTAPVTVASGLVLVSVPSTSQLVALSRDLSRVVWSDSIHAAPGTAATSTGGLVYIGETTGVMHALSATTGLSLWSKRAFPCCDENGDAFPDLTPFRTAVTRDGSDVYVTSDQGWLHHFSGGGYRGSVQLADNPVAAPSYAAGLLWAGDDNGFLSASDSSTVYWRMLTSGPVVEAPMISDGMVFVQTGSGARRILQAYGLPTAQRALLSRPNPTALAR
jgi:outer membrane protein assembly factor BamB